MAEEDSQATVLEDYVSLDGGVAFSKRVTEMVAGEHTVLPHYMIEREDTQGFQHLHAAHPARTKRECRVSLGSAGRRHWCATTCTRCWQAKGGECLINGLFIGNGQQHLDNYMQVEHASPHCGSRQFYNGILDGNAHGVFHGRIIVHKDAQKTDAKQTNRNLLLSDDAQIDTKPQLEIYADDVKCTHGATIGQIDEDALFYLRSRGIDEASARKLLLLRLCQRVSRPHEAGAGPRAPGRADQRASVPDGQHCAWCVDRIRRDDTGRNWEESDDHRCQEITQRVRPPTCTTPAASSTSRGSAATFPSCSRGFTGKPLVYLDNAATSQKPQVVIDAICRYYERDNANIHRGVHFLSEHATEEYEEARRTVQTFPQRCRCARDHLRPRRHRSHQPRGAELRPHARSRRRRSAHHRHGAPLQHRALADPVRREGREAAGCADERPRRAATRGV